MRCLDPYDTVALSNLERLRRERGEIQLADAIQRRIRGHRLENPYFRYHSKLEGLKRVNAG
ncbi:MAG: hypothetical protein FJ197_07025 [Gammaproteobacteria bacterium]|nr:hypothetical protein [Gammaproteobacteria bacterium]